MHTRNLSLLFTLLITIACFSCRQNRVTIEGDLYFAFLRIGSLYGQPDSIVKGFIMYADTVDRTHIQPGENHILSMYDILKKRQMLYSPFVNIQVNQDSLIILYLDKSDYDKIKIYHHKELRSENRKVRIKASVEPMGYNMYLCKSLQAVDKVDGTTFQTPGKFLIEDYK
jgi:hypothetical protein